METKKELPGGFSPNSSTYNWARQILMDTGAIDDPRKNMDTNITQQALSTLGRRIELNDIMKLEDGRVVLPYKSKDDLFVFVFSPTPIGTRIGYNTNRLDVFKNGKHIGDYMLGHTVHFESELTPIFDKLLGSNGKSVAEGVSQDPRAPRKNLLQEVRSVIDLLNRSGKPFSGKGELSFDGESTKTHLQGNFKNGVLDGEGIETIEGTNFSGFNPGSKVKIIKKGYFENGKILDGTMKIYVGGKFHKTEIIKDGQMSE